MLDLPNRAGSILTRFVPAVMIVAACLGQPSVIALAPEVPAAPVVVHGTATTTSGKPLAGATLYLIDLPGGQYLSQYLPNAEDKARVTTDSLGHFAWTVPKEVAWNFSTDVPKESSAPQCYALPLGAGWRATVVLASNWQGANAQIGRRNLWEQAAKRCETHWTETGKNPAMTVVAPDTGQVTLTVRGPNGRALANHAVEVVAPGTFSDYEGAVVYDGETDAAGRLQMRRYSGLLRLLVTVPGIGFGSTGTFELLPDGQAAPALPLLASFAHVSGSLTPMLLKPGAFVHVDDYMPDEHRWYDPHAVVDAQGRFRLDGVLPGRHRLALVGGQQEAEAIEVTASPGEEITGLTLKPKAADPINGPSNPLPVPAVQAAKPAVRGRVTDTAGQPVAGAEVYALCSYFGGMQMLEDTFSTKSGPDGGYEMDGLPVGQGGIGISLLAVKAGFPVAVASAETDPAVGGALPDSPAGYHGDLVLPSGHPGLTIQVLQEGKPLSGAAVHLTPHTEMSLFGLSGFPEFSGRYMGTAAHWLERERVDACLAPSGVTDASGEVRFRDITPGLWDVSANLAGPPTPSGSSQAGVYAAGQGLAVTTGPPRRFTLSVSRQSGEVALRVLAPSGQPPASSSVSLEFGPAGFPNGSGTSLTLDKDGQGGYSLDRPGLWRIVTRFRDTGLDSYPASTEPFYEGSTLFAVSPILPPAERVLIRTVRHGPGQIRVRLFNGAGHPAAGSVSIGDVFNAAKYSASVGTDGETVFPEMPSGSYILKAAFLKPSAPPALGSGDAAFPADAALSHSALLMPQTAVVTSDTETLVTFRPQRMGYVRGRLRVPDAPENYGVFPSGYSEMPAAYRYNPKTYEFVVGPFPAGPNMLWISRTTPKGALSTTTGQTWTGQTFPVDIPAGQVVHVVFTPVLQSPVIPLRNRPVTGRVFLADGTTPAWGARAALVVPETEPPVRMARTGALGRLNITDYWRSDNRPLPPMPGSPTGPVLVAWLPGTTGAVIVPADGSEARLVLPPSISASGRVTVGGQPVRGSPSSFQVLAAYQGRGKLNPLLDVEATAQADGTFTLPGLTPGTYRVQAARDCLWLSETQTLIVSADSPLTPLILDIAPPGVVMLLHLTDLSGKALPSRTVALNRPAGPLTDLLWPPTATADSNGDLRLDGLEAGRQTIEGTVSFTVPMQSGTAPRTAVTRILVLRSSAPEKGQL